MIFQPARHAVLALCAAALVAIPGAAENLDPLTNQEHVKQLAPPVEPQMQSVLEPMTLEPPSSSDVVPGAIPGEPYAVSYPAICCPQPKLTYRNALRLLDHHRCPCGCVEKVNVIVVVPSACCPVEVPLCVPACCDLTPTMKRDRGFLGRCVYRFCWPSGYEVKVVERKHKGDYLVVCDAR